MVFVNKGKRTLCKDADRVGASFSAHRLRDSRSAKASMPVLYGLSLELRARASSTTRNSRPSAPPTTDIPIQQGETMTRVTEKKTGIVLVAGPRARHRQEVGEILRM